MFFTNFLHEFNFASLIFAKTPVFCMYLILRIRHLFVKISSRIFFPLKVKLNTWAFATEHL